MTKEKESGLTKLIELLNEYLFTLGRKTIIQSFDDRTLNDYCGTFRGIVEGKTDYPYTAIRGIEVISKKFGFIKWLVENEKIGDNKNSDRYTMMKLMRAEINEGTEVFEGTERYEFVIMLLSIQDEPINFLISILK